MKFYTEQIFQEFPCHRLSALAADLYLISKWIFMGAYCLSEA